MSDEAKPDPEEKPDTFRATKTRQAQQAAFLEKLAVGLTVRDGCLAAGIGRQTAYDWRQKDEVFALAWHDAVEFGTDCLEAEARRRAAEGVEHAIFHGEIPIGTEIKYSDTLLIFLLKGRRPEKFRDQAKIEHSGSIDGRQTVTVEGGAFAVLNPADLTPEEQDILADALARKRGDE